MTKKDSSLDLSVRNASLSGIRFARGNNLHSSQHSENGKISLRHGQYIFLENFPVLSLGDKIVIDLESMVYPRIIGTYKTIATGMNEDGHKMSIPIYLLELVHEPTKDELKTFPLSLIGKESSETKYYAAKYD